MKDVVVALVLSTFPLRVDMGITDNVASLAFITMSFLFLKLLPFAIVNASREMGFVNPVIYDLFEHVRKSRGFAEKMPCCATLKKIHKRMFITYILLAAKRFSFRSRSQ